MQLASYCTASTVYSTVWLSSWLLPVACLGLWLGPPLFPVNSLPQAHRLPTISAWVSSSPGSQAGSQPERYIYGMHAWLMAGYDRQLHTTLCPAGERSASLCYTFAFLRALAEAMQRMYTSLKPLRASWTVPPPPSAIPFRDGTCVPWYVYTIAIYIIHA